MTKQQQYLTAWLKDNINNAQVNPLFDDDINVGIHNDYYYGTENDIDFIFVALPSTMIADNIYQYPFQLFVQSTSKYSSDVYDFLNKLFSLNNRGVRTYSSTKYRMFLNSPTMPNKMADKGFERYDLMQLDITLFTYQYTEAYSIDYVNISTIATDDDIVPLSFNVVYSASTSSTGSVGSTTPKAMLETGMTQYQLTFVADKDVCTDFLDVIIKNNYLTRKYPMIIAFENDDIDDISVSDLLLINGTYSQDVNGYPIMSLTFIKGA